MDWTLLIIAVSGLVVFLVVGLPLISKKTSETLSTVIPEISFPSLEPIGNAFKGFGEGVSELGSGLSEGVSTLGIGLSDALSSVSEVLSKIGDSVKDTIDTVTDTVKDVKDTITGTTEQAKNVIINPVGSVAGAFGTVVSAISPTIPEATKKEAVGYLVKDPIGCIGKGFETMATMTGRKFGEIGQATGNVVVKIFNPFEWFK